MALIPLAAIIASSFASPVQAKTAMKNGKLFERLAADFSRFPFDMKEEDASKLKQKGIIYSEDEGGSGTLIDENGVEHYFYEGLFAKAIKPKAGQPIKAAGIGTSRKQKDVLAAFKKYSGGKKMECFYATDEPHAFSSDNPKKRPHAKSCHFLFDRKSDESFDLEFDDKGVLKEIRLQAWNPF
ncbi:MAG: hypothetical protein ACRCY3_13360 [Sphingorhabdus sp.]